MSEERTFPRLSSLPGERIVDARYLEPPAPFVRVMEMLGDLAPGEAMGLRLFREPHPLYRVLQQNGHRWQTSLQPDGTFEIVILG